MFLRASLLKLSSFYSIPCHPLLPVSLSSSICSSPRTPFSIRCHSALPISHEPSSSAPSQFPDVADNRWRPTCLYFTHGRCTMMDDPLHIKKFNHDISRELQVDVARSNHMRTQDVDYFLVLDLEGKVEIIEFPVILVNAKTMGVTGFFHRFVRPSRMSEKRINEYIEGKYGKFGVDRVWHDTAILYNDVIQQFEDWLVQHQLWRKERGGVLDRAAFVTCGNWDIKTQVPHQCNVSKMKLPDYFMEWINIKDVYLNFYGKKATGMATMMRQLEMCLVGSHHLGIDDTKNIVRVLQRMVGDGAHLQITARRNPKSPQQVKFLFENRI
uniref:Exonuclease domain-containing protein n=2 Tax=Cucumis melo TaxID=3656 RepID=A0A9I9DZF3_CUCME